MTKAATSSSLKQRSVSAAVLAPLVILAVALGEWPFVYFCMAVSLFAVQEWVRMVEPKAVPTVEILATLGIVPGLVLASIFGVLESAALLLPLVCLAAIFDSIYGGKYPERVGFGTFYIGYSMTLLIWMREQNHGLFYVLLLLFIIWSSDIFAYFFGKMFGGPKMAPTVSPKKTWAGLIGSMVGPALVAPVFVELGTRWFFADAFGTPLFNMGLPVFSLQPHLVVAFIAACCGFTGQAGDLLISLIKRQYGMKDTGNLIPGHGGILDRIDSLLLATLLFAVVLKVMQ